MGSLAKTASPLVAAASALDEELRAYDALAAETRGAVVANEKSLERALSLISDSASYGETIQLKLQALVFEIEAARQRQVESLNTLIEAAHRVQARAEQHAVLTRRFSELGESAQRVNAMTVNLSARRSDGASETEVLEGLRAIQDRMTEVVSEAETLRAIAEEGKWPDFVRSADSIRQQVLAAKNRLSLARRSFATRAPS